MVSNLTVMKHNQPKNKYPTHDSGIMWQPPGPSASMYVQKYAHLGAKIVKGSCKAR